MAYSIIIVPYDANWPDLFKQYASPMRNALDEVALRIDHIGSTAVPGLAAKPIIDIQISVASFDPIDLFRLPLESLGYIWRENNDDLTKRYFREAPGTRRTHIHVRRAGSWSEQFALLFRDYIRTHEDAARRYEDEKRRLAELYREERHIYTEAKGPIIWEIMIQADLWSKATGWTPGPSDV